MPSASISQKSGLITAQAPQLMQSFLKCSTLYFAMIVTKSPVIYKNAQISRQIHNYLPEIPGMLPDAELFDRNEASLHLSIFLNGFGLFAREVLLQRLWPN